VPAAVSVCVALDLGQYNLLGGEHLLAARHQLEMGHKTAVSAKNVLMDIILYSQMPNTSIRF
jgi:hypothetical protein